MLGINESGKIKNDLLFFIKLEKLRNELLIYLKIKFSNIADIENLAEDLVQDAFLRINDPEKLHFGYLSVICKNLVHDELKSLKKRQIIYDDVDSFTGNVTLEEEIYKQEEISAISSSIETLNETEKSIVTLRHYENHTFKDIGEKLNCNCNTVRTIYYRALSKLKPIVDAGEKKRILVVDDEDFYLSLAEYVLKPEYNINTANSGKKALDVICNGQIPDLILLDILMPEMDGFEVYSKLRQIVLLRETPIVFLTSVNVTDTIQKAMNIGAVDYIVKPYNKKDLLNRIKSVIKNQKLP